MITLWIVSFGILISFLVAAYAVRAYSVYESVVEAYADREVDQIELFIFAFTLAILWLPLKLFSDVFDGNEGNIGIA